MYPSEKCVRVFMHVCVCVHVYAYNSLYEQEFALYKQVGVFLFLCLKNNHLVTSRGKLNIFTSKFAHIVKK